MKIKKIKEEETMKAEEKAVQIIAKARKSAEAKEKEILENTSLKTEKMIEGAKIDISMEREKITDEIKKEMERYIILAIEKVLERTLK